MLATPNADLALEKLKAGSRSTALRLTGSGSANLELPASLRGD
jgi:hypothetical protein